LKDVEGVRDGVGEEVGCEFFELLGVEIPFDEVEVGGAEGVDGEVEEGSGVSDEVVSAGVDLSWFAANFDAAYGHRGDPVIEFSCSGRAVCRYDRQVEECGAGDDECISYKNADPNADQE